MKKATTVFWITTTLIFLTQSIGELFAYMNGSATTGITGLGYPGYFVGFLVVAKLLGGIALMFPTVSPKIKEWAYAGFTFDFIAAFVSIVATMGFVAPAMFPVIALVILWLSYRSFHSMKEKMQSVSTS